MALGPRLDLRQSQSLVMTPQLQQAIKLLALSNLEIETFIAEELEKNPLLESERGPAGDDEAPAATEPETGEGAKVDPDFLPEADAAGSVSNDGSSISGSGDGPDLDAFAEDDLSLNDHLRSHAGGIFSGVDLVI